MEIAEEVLNRARSVLEQIQDEARHATIMREAITELRGMIHDVQTEFRSLAASQNVLAQALAELGATIRAHEGRLEEHSGLGERVRAVETQLSGWDKQRSHDVNRVIAVAGIMAAIAAALSFAVVHWK